MCVVFIKSISLFYSIFALQTSAHLFAKYGKYLALQGVSITLNVEYVYIPMYKLLF